MERSERVRWTLHGLSAWLSPPHPDPLPARGEREHTELAAPADPIPPQSAPAPACRFASCGLPPFAPQPLERVLDRRVRDARRAPAVEQAVGEPDHQEGEDAGE